MKVKIPDYSIINKLRLLYLNNIYHNFWYFFLKTNIFNNNIYIIYS